MRPGRLDREVFDSVSSREGQHLLSLVLPTHRAGPDTEADRILLKNLIKETDDLLEANGWKPRPRSELLDPVRSLLEDLEFWQHQQAGVAVYRDDEGGVESWSLPIHDGSRIATVGSSFHVRHLVPSLELLTHPVLALTRRAVALYRAGRHQITRIDADLPGSVDDVNWFVDREAQIQRHSEAAGSARHFHGHDPSEREQEDLNRFLRAVSDAVVENDELVVVGDDSLVARFAHIHRRPVMSPPNSGLSDAEDPQAVHAMVRHLFEEEEAAIAAKSAEEAATAIGAGTAIVDLEECLQAATIGRISDLIIRRGASPRWGRWDTNSLELSAFDGERRIGEDDLLDRMVVLAFGTGSQVRSVPHDLDGHDFVALPRF